MAFYTWIDSATPGTNVMATSDFSSDAQRSGGFTSGTVASSIRVNTALRQCTLITNALMKALGLDSLSYTDATNTIQTQITDFLDGRKVEALTTLDGTETSALGFKIGSAKYEFPSGGSSVTANPTLDGTEAALTGLTVLGTKYSVLNELSGTFTVTASGNTLSGGRYTIVGHQLTLVLPSMAAWMSLSLGTTITLTDGSSIWSTLGAITAEDVSIVGADAGNGYHIPFRASKVALSSMIVLTAGCGMWSNGTAVYAIPASGIWYYLQYFGNPIITLYI